MATRIELIVDDTPNVQVENCIRRVTGNIETLLRDFPNAVVRYTYEKAEVEIALIKPKIEDVVVDENTILNSSLDTILLNERTQSLLFRCARLATDTVGELCQLSARDLLSIEQFGNRCLLDVRLALAVHGLHLKNESVHNKLNLKYRVKYLGGLSPDCRRALVAQRVMVVAGLVSLSESKLAVLTGFSDNDITAIQDYLALLGGLHLANDTAES